MPVSVKLSLSALALSVVVAASAAPGKQEIRRGVDPVGKVSAPAGLPRSTQKALGDLPQRFEMNEGQFPSAVRYVARSHGHDLYLTDTESILVLYKARGKELKDGMDYTTLRMSVRGARPARGWESGKALPGVTSYFHGQDSTAWRRNVPSYESATAKGVKPGVDLVWYGKEKKLEYDLVVAPGVDASKVEIAWNGARSMTVDTAGNLVLDTVYGQVVQQRPYVYQMVNGREVKIEARYSLRPNEGAGFELARYDHKLPLVIDPSLLVYSTFLGTAPSSGNSVVADAAGNVYLLGQSFSAAFPFVSPFQTAHADSSLFMAKFKPSGAELVYATYLGGTASEIPYGLAVDAAGAAYIQGVSLSTNYPLRTPVQATIVSTNPLVGDLVVTKLLPAGNDLAFSTFLGAANGSAAQGIVVAPDGSVVVAAYQAGAATFSPSPRVLNASTGRGVIFRFTPAGNALQWVTYLGDVVIGGIGVDASGVYFGGDNQEGRPNYTAINAPPGLLQNRTNDAVLGKLNPTGTALLYYTHFGGSGEETIRSVAVDSTGALYAGGATRSADLPLQTPFRNALGGTQDGFIVKLSPAGNSIAYSTYIGGSLDDYIQAVSVDPAGGLAIVGTTFSKDIVQKDSQQAASAGVLQEAFVIKLSPAGNVLDFSTYLGGTGEDYGGGISATAGGQVYVTGITDGIGFTTKNAFQSATPGGFVAYLTKYTVNIAPGAQVPTVTSATPTATSGTQQTFSFTVADGDGAADLGIVNVLINNFLDGRNACYIAYSRPANTVFLVTNDGSGLTSLLLNGSGTTSNGQCTIVGAGSSAVSSGNSLTLTLVVQFNTTTFAGRKVLYAAARDAAENNSGWQPMGVYGVATPLAANPMVVSLAPASGTGSTATLAITYRDATAGTNLQPSQILIGSALDASNACYIAYVNNGNQLYLVTDTGLDLITPGITPGATSGFTEKSQCRVDAVGSSKSLSGNSMTLTVNITFYPGFAGRKIIYGGTQTLGGANSGWHAMGAWTVQ